MFKSLLKRAFIGALFLFCFQIPVAFAVDISLLSRSPEWLKLLHYKRTLWGNYKSEITEPDFFLSPTGPRDPLAELQRSLEAFNVGQAETEKLTPACRFPARHAFLKEKFPEAIKDVNCPELEKWKSPLDAVSVTLVFSSYFQGAPASIFGHTFLRLDKKEVESYQDLSVDYAAQVGDDNILVQVPKGLFGFYKGAFTAMPYYVKVKAYNNAENRDLFEYKLNFTQTETRKLILHLWELNRANMDYVFAKRNCSYEILALIEAARPDWVLTEKLIMTAAPINTVRVLRDNTGALKDVQVRPSLKEKLQAKWDGLQDQEKDDYFKIIDFKMSPQKITSPMLAEAVGLHFAILQIQNNGTLPAQEAEVFHQANVRRSELGASMETPVKDKPRPDLAHEMSRISLGLGHSSQGPFLEPGARLTLHELIENDDGYVPNSTLEFFKFRGRIQKHLREDATLLTLEEATAINFISLNPFRRLDYLPSYELNLGAYNPGENDCQNCLVGHLRAGLGATVEIAPTANIYLLTAMEVDSGNMFESNLRYGSGLRGGFIFRIFPKFKINLNMNWMYYFNQRENKTVLRSELAHGYSWSSKTETHLFIRTINSKAEGMISQSYYF